MNFNVPELLDATFVIKNTVSTAIMSGIPVRCVFLYFVPNVLGFDVKNALTCTAKPVSANMDLNVIIIKQLFVVTREQQNKSNKFFIFFGRPMSKICDWLQLYQLL